MSTNKLDNMDPTSGLKAGLLILKHQDKITTAVKKLISLLKYGNIRIAVTGAAGTGKSTLGLFLGGQKTPGVLHRRYKESGDIEPHSLDGDLYGTVHVSPGQPFRIEEARPKLIKELSKAKNHGIINVVSWGYHSPDLPFNSIEEQYKSLKPEEFIPIYTANRRDRELEVLANLVPYLENIDGKLWMITLIIKQDIWWQNRDEVQTHYNNGKYNNIIDTIRKNRGPRNFRHAIRSVSIVRSNFVDGRGTILAETSSGFEETYRLSEIENFIDCLTSMARQK